MEWKEVKLGDVCDLIAGFAFKAKDFGTYDSKAIKIGDINPPFVNYYSEIGVDISKYDEKKLNKYLVFRGDYVLAMTGATIGKVGRYIHCTPSYLNQRVLKFSAKEGYDSDFIYYIVSSPVFSKYVINHIDSESAQPNISANTISKYEFRTPANVSDQRRISSILSSLDAKIENNNKINAKLEEIASNLFKNWFVDFAPFADGEFENSELGMIPKGWKVGKLGDVAEINPKLTIKKGEEATYLDMGAMPTNGSFPSEWIKRNYAGGMKFQNNDTIMARITPCLENGKVAFVNFLEDGETAFGSTEYIVMRPKNGLLPETLYCLCRYDDFVGYATKNMNGSSGRQRVSGETIGNYAIAIPPIDAVKHLAPVFKSLFEQIKINGFENKRLATLRDTLLPKLMSGEIDLDESNGIS